MLNYKFYQDHRKDSNTKGQWFARVATNGTITTDEIADRIQANCTLKKSDIKACIQELVEEISEGIKNSYVVKLDGLGSFRMSIHSTSAPTQKEFSPVQNIVGYRVRFAPERHIYVSNGKRHTITTMVNGTKVQLAPSNGKVNEATSGTGTSGTGDAGTGK